MTSFVLDPKAPPSQVVLDDADVAVLKVRVGRLVEVGVEGPVEEVAPAGDEGVLAVGRQDDAGGVVDLERSLGLA